MSWYLISLMKMETRREYKKNVSKIVLFNYILCQMGIGIITWVGKNE